MVNRLLPVFNFEQTQIVLTWLIKFLFMDSNQKKKLRSKLFRHLDGIVIAPTAHTLKKHGITDYLLKQKKSSLSELCSQFNANDGYLNVALRGLCSQGWLIQHVNNIENTVHFEINHRSEIAFQFFDLYEDVVKLLKLSGEFHPRKFEVTPFLELERIYKSFISGNGSNNLSTDIEKEVYDQIRYHIEGIIVGPTTVFLGITSMFHKYFMETRFKPEEFHEDPEYFERLLNILAGFGWFEVTNGTYKFTEYGLFFAKRATAYGVTISYIPTLRRLDDLIFGDPKTLRTDGIGEAEQHVDREMNIWGSGGAHAAYFKVLDEIVIEIFNKPIGEQPKGILDMGCGNGAFLQHLFSVIETRTTRGQMLDEHPLQLIGVDYNEAALKVTRANLIQADIWAKVIWGDIGNPDQLAETLKANYDINLEDLLNVRTFLDHNRVWEAPKNGTSIKSSSTGAFAHRGKRLNNNDVAQSLQEHMEKWMPYVGKHGLLLIELHTAKPELVAKNLGYSAATAYDLTHGYSDQYIIEVDEFLSVVQLAGLQSDPSAFKKFPDSDLATVSINLLKAV